MLRGEFFLIQAEYVKYISRLHIQITLKYNSGSKRLKRGFV